VYLPLDIATFLLTQHSPAEEFFFIERGLLGRVEWAGTMHELRQAISREAVSAGDIRGLTLPTVRTHEGWEPLAEEDAHELVGAKRGELTHLMQSRGRVDTAAAMEVEAWVQNARSEGACMASIADEMHGQVWCAADRGHGAGHIPLCAECDIVKQIMFATAQSAGTWGR
jgi:hypothetical protein